MEKRTAFSTKVGGFQEKSLRFQGNSIFEVPSKHPTLLTHTYVGKNYKGKEIIPG